jgi:hypothetical protein
VRCEARLANVAPEFFAEHPEYLDNDDRALLASLAEGTQAA